MKSTKTFQKKLSLFIGIILIHFTYGQELTNEHKQMLKYDNTAYFATLVNKENINACYPIENTAYTLLGLAIKMNSKEIFQKLIDEKADLEKTVTAKPL
jgi:hypothetical protein